MGKRPETLIVHTVFANRWTDASKLREAIETELPDVDLRIAETPPESERKIETADVVIASDLPTELLDAARNLQLVQALHSGVDSYDLDRLQSEGIVLTNAAGVHAAPIAEQVLGYMLLFERRIHRGIRQQARRAWESYDGGELRNKTAGIIGVGAIGQEVAELAQALDLEVLGIKRNVEEVPAGVDELFGPDELYTLLKRSDYVVVACPLTEETEGMLGYQELACMRGSAVLINIARGEIVNQDALTEMLQKRRIRGAALDVFDEEPLAAESPLWDLSNVVITPHMAGTTPRKTERFVDTFARNYRAFVDDSRSYATRVL